MKHIKLSPLKKFLMTVLVFLLNVTYHTNLFVTGYSCSNTQGTNCFKADSGVLYARLVNVWCSTYTYFCFTGGSLDVGAAQTCEYQSCDGTGQSGNKVWDPQNGNCIDYGCTCKSGYYVSGHTCLPCLAGNACPGGRYLAYENGGSTVCPSGTYAASTAATCTSCIPGYYAESPGKSACSPCPSGSYQSRYGSHGCNLCLPGTYSSRPGAPSCSPCAVGWYASTYGSTSCASCSKGYYQPSEGQTACSPCPAGHFAATSGMSTCNLCSSGYWVSGTGNRSCNSCFQSVGVSFAGNFASSVSDLSLSGPVGATSPTACYIVAKSYSLSDDTGTYKNASNCQYYES